MQHGTMASVLQMVGTTALIVSTELLLYILAYPYWAEWQQQSHSEVLRQHLTDPVSREAIPDQTTATGFASLMPLPSTRPAVADNDLRGALAAAPLAGPLPSEFSLAEDSAIQARSQRRDFSPTPLPSYGRPILMQIPGIRVDSAVTEVGVRNGEYEVPWWNVGHHVDSSYPGERGNSVFNGHLDTINAGRVFARLNALEVGDMLYVDTPTHRVAWVIEEARTVPSSDSSFIWQTQDTRITLYTCAGTYDRLARHYSQWLVVTGRMVEIVPTS